MRDQQGSKTQHILNTDSKVLLMAETKEEFTIQENAEEMESMGGEATDPSDEENIQNERLRDCVE